MECLDCSSTVIYEADRCWVCWRSWKFLVVGWHEDADGGLEPLFPVLPGEE